MSKESTPANHEDDIEAVIACLGDDAAGLRDDNPEDERADNMDAAAATIRSLCKQLDELRATPATVGAAPEGVRSSYSASEWDQAVRTIYLNARTSSVTQGIPSEMLEAMRDRLLAASPAAPKAAPQEAEGRPVAIIDNSEFVAARQQWKMVVWADTEFRSRTRLYASPAAAPQPASVQPITDERIRQLGDRTGVIFPGHVSFSQVARFAHLVEFDVLSALLLAPRVQAAPLTDEECERIHSMSFIRACLLAYVDRPRDAEAAAGVRGIVNAVNGRAVGAAPTKEEGK